MRAALIPIPRFVYPQLRRVCCWGMLLALALAAGGCKAKPTTKTPSGTLRLFLRAAKERDLKTMKSYCEGLAVEHCEGLLTIIEEMEKSGKASRFESWNPSAGPAPTGPRANAFADLFGINRDLFLRVSVTLQQDKKKRWKIDQLVWESKHPKDNPE